jgi:hypothetical protein
VCKQVTHTRRLVGHCLRLCRQQPKRAAHRIVRRALKQEMQRILHARPTPTRRGAHEHGVTQRRRGPGSRAQTAQPLGAGHGRAPLPTQAHLQPGPAQPQPSKGPHDWQGQAQTHVRGRRAPLPVAAAGIKRIHPLSVRGHSQPRGRSHARADGRHRIPHSVEANGSQATT